jgi:exodeoxyribonuclease VII large subunit
VSSLFDLPFEEPAEETPSEPEISLRRSGERAAGGNGEAPSSTPQALTPAAPRRQILTVSALTAHLRQVLENTFPEIWVEGELSNARVWNTGHLYFTLKDGASQIKGVMFRTALRALRFKPEDGLHVVVRGRVSVYDVKGEYQLVGEHMEPHGFGSLQLAFEQLKKKLAAEGLFDGARKRPLPTLPRRIGIVTSIDGAALRDIIRVLGRRYPNANTVIAPSRVQGEGAAGEIVRALRLLSRVPGVDVVIVGRGGGSLEDLWAFNEEKVARAIANCPVPVISAVGHETDFTIADFVADVRAATPSAAAELVVRRKDEFCSYIDRLGDGLEAAMRRRLARAEARLKGLLARPAYAGQHGRMAMRGRHVAELSAALRHEAASAITRRLRRYDVLRRALSQHDPRHRLGAVRSRLIGQDARLTAGAGRRVHVAEGRFKEIVARLQTLSPLAVLGRGYAVAWDATRTRILRDPRTVAPGEDIIVTLDKGELRSTVR